jgi:hypothetical protein
MVFKNDVSLKFKSILMGFSFFQETDAHLDIIVSQVPTPQVPVPQATSSQVTKLRMSHGVYCVQEESTVTHQVYLQKMVTVMQVCIIYLFLNTVNGLVLTTLVHNPTSPFALKVSEEKPSWSICTVTSVILEKVSHNLS